MRKLNLLVIAETFPLISEAFVVNHLVSIQDKVGNIEIFSFSQPKASQAVNPLVEKYRLLQKTTYGYAVPNNILLRFGKALLLALRHIRYLPLFYRALNVKKYGVRAYRLKLLYHLAGLLRMQKPDIIHCHFGTMAYELLLVKSLGLFRDIPVVVYFHGYDIQHVNLDNYPNYHQLLFKEASKVYTNSEYSRKQLVNLGCQTTLEVLPASFNASFFQRDSEMPSSEKFRIVSVGRLIELKGMDTSIDVIAELVRQGYKNIVFNIIGEGPERTKLEQKIKDLQLQQYVNLCGAMPQDQVKEYLSRSDIFLLMGRYDSFNRAEAQGLVIQEAQAMGLPVIVTDIGGMPEGVIANETGFIIDPDCPEVAVDKIKLLIENPERRKKFSAKSIEFAKHKYSNKTIGGKWLDEYHELLNYRLLVKEN